MVEISSYIMTKQLKLRTNKDFRLHYLLVAHHKQSEPYGDIQLFTVNKKEMLEVRALKKSIKVSISFQKKKKIVFQSNKY